MKIIRENIWTDVVPEHMNGSYSTVDDERGFTTPPPSKGSQRDVVYPG
jgi:hypothetical protein